MTVEVALGKAGLTFADALTKLAAGYAARSMISGAEKVLRVKKNLTPHIDATFRRCISIKTLLNPLAPVDFLSIYATQRFIKGDKSIDHYALVDIVKRGRDNLIVTGTGGSGKSMFMRYLWLSLFEDGDGRVPIFIELRNINSVSDFNFENYILHSLTLGESTISGSDFRKGLVAGDFVLLLDGFDEVSQDKQDLVQGSIMDLALSYPNLRVILSSRPDNVFASWTSFYVYSVGPMSKPDVIELVEKSGFDEVSKARFIKKIKEDLLYDTHRSFMSNPLLCSMMLLTFSVNYDIPNKMHLFYEQAFDALYKRHDSHKPGGYKREFKSNLSEDEFKRLLSYFCLISYHREKFEFDSEEILENIRKACAVDGFKVEPSDFLSDLTTCICFIVLDGLKYTFSHRSFQEYFSAYCLAYVTGQEILPILRSFSKRSTDQVISLLADMNPELFREKYVIPNAKEFAGGLQLKRKEKDVVAFMADARITFGLHYIPVKGGKAPEQIFTLGGDGELYHFFDVISGHFAAGKYGGGLRFARGEKPETARRDLRKVLGSVSASQVSISADKSGLHYMCFSKVDKVVPQIIRMAEADQIFLESGMFDFLSDRLRRAATYIQSIERKSDKSSVIMNELFGI